MPDIVTGPEKDEKILGGKGKGAGKYKWYIIGGLALVAVLVFYFVQRSGSASSAGAASPSTATDPNTGQPVNSYNGIGPEGPAGPAGPRGPRGRPPKKPKKVTSTDKKPGGAMMVRKGNITAAAGHVATHNRRIAA